MDQGPFRMPRSSSNARQPETPEKSVEEPKPTQVEEHKPVHRTPSVRQPYKKERSKLPYIIAAAATAIVLVVVGIWMTIGSMSGGASGIDGGKYQAVFFTNGQVYFGKLQSFNDEYMKLTDVYYLQTQQSEDESSNPQQTSSDQGDVQLIKLGDEIHGPEDEMVIARDQVLFFENLKSDGKVSQSIEQHKKAN